MIGLISIASAFKFFFSHSNTILYSNNESDNLFFLLVKNLSKLLAIEKKIKKKVERLIFKTYFGISIYVFKLFVKQVTLMAINILTCIALGY